MHTDSNGMTRRLPTRQLTLSLALLAFTLLGLPAAAHATHDSVQTPGVLPLNTFESTNNAGATEQPGEPLTLANNTYCNLNDGSERYTGATLWYRVSGIGGQIDLSTEGSAIDTLLAVYNSADTPTISNVLCADDFSASDRTSRLSFIATLGRDYLVQVGGTQFCQPSPCAAGVAPVTPPQGPIRLIARGTAPAQPVQPQPTGPNLPTGPGLPTDPAAPAPQPTAPPVAVPVRFNAEATLTRVRHGRRNVRAIRLSVSGPTGARVRVTCTRGGCRSFSGTVVRRRGITRPLRVPTLSRRILRHGSELRVFITRPGSIGTFIRWRVRRGIAIKSGRRCLPPGTLIPRACR